MGRAGRGSRKNPLSSPLNLLPDLTHVYICDPTPQCLYPRKASGNVLRTSNILPQALQCNIVIYYKNIKVLYKTLFTNSPENISSIVEALTVLYKICHYY